MIEEVRRHLEQLLASGVIRKSKSPWASNIVLVRKKNGKLRMCVDYRMLNNRTIKDAYALPRIEDIFDCLHGSQYFSTIDMKSGYHQVEIEEEHKERTAFTVGPLGFWEFNKLAFGLSNSPSTYQRLMEECLGEYNMKICVIYLDDLIIFSNTIEEHLERLHLIFTRLKECGLLLAPEKCFFIQKRIKFLGHVVSQYGIETDPEKIEKIRNYPKPINSDELRSFLAFCGYYRKFVKDFSKLTKPLTELLPPTSTKKRFRTKDIEWKWEEIHDVTFEKLKEVLTTPPILAYPNFDMPFELHTDASGYGLGAVLYQKQGDQKKVIAYASRSLTKSEKNYSAYKLEFLALKWSITEKFSDYLEGNTFTVYTDNNPLTHILTSAKLDATGQRWVAALSDYNFNIVYRPGAKNIDADTLSRYPRTKQSEEETIDNKSIKAICNTIHLTPFVDILSSQNINIIEALDGPNQTLAQIETREIRRCQREDTIIGVWHRATTDKQLPDKQLIASNPKHQTMKRIFDNFNIIRGILYRKTHDNGKELNQLVLPSIYRDQVLQGLHNDVGHPGKDRTGSLIKERFYWPGYLSDVDRWVTTCDRCLRRKSNTTKAPMVSIVSNYPLERVCMDFLTVEPCQGNIENILVITDYFTKFSIAVPTRNQTTKTTADALLNHFFLIYGIPTKLHSDQGKNFESDLMKELCKLMNVQKTRTSIYHPMGNGQTERYNRTLLNMLGTLEQEQKANWKKYIPTLVYSYNATRHESTGYSPFELMFGRKPKLPIDSVFNIDNNNNEDYITSDYIKELQERLKISHDVASKQLEKSRLKQKVQFDKKAKATKVSVGDTVLVRILAYDGKHKISDKFEKETYTVMSQPNEDIPVYIVKAEGGTERRLHRNHILPIEVKEDGCEDVEKDLVDDIETTVKERPVPKPRRSCERPVVATRKSAEKSDTVIDSAADCDRDDISSSESEEEFVIAYSRDKEWPATSSSEVREDVDRENVGRERDIISERNIRKEEVPEEDVTEDGEDRRTSDDELAQAQAAPPPPKPPPRKSARTRKKPDRYGEYVVTKQQTLEKQENDVHRRIIRAVLQEQSTMTARLLDTVLMSIAK